MEKIKNTEAEATKIIERAQKEKLRLIEEAWEKTLEILKKQEVEMGRERELELKKVQEELAGQHENKIKKTSIMIEKNKNDAGKKIQKEVDFLYEKFMEMVLSD